MRALVIGGNGFIGSHVVDEFLHRGADVCVYDRRAEPFRPPLGQVEYVLRDLADIEDVFERVDGIDVVVHLASTTVPATSNLDPEGDITGNLISAVRLLRAMRRAGVRRLVYLSSGGTVYGIPETDPIPEAHPLRPISSYGIVKVAIENYLHMEHQLHGLEYVVIRPGNAYGPRETRQGIQGIIGTHLARLARQEQIELWGDGTVVRDFIFVKDLASLCVTAAQSTASGRFNAGSGRGVSMAELVRVVQRLIPGTPDPVRLPSRDYDVPRVVLDISKASRELGWHPVTALEDGIAETWTWVNSLRAPVPDRSNRSEN